MSNCNVHKLHASFRPLRTREEEHSFIYGDVVDDIIDLHEKNTPVTLDWAPPGVSSRVRWVNLTNEIQEL